MGTINIDDFEVEITVDIKPNTRDLEGFLFDMDEAGDRDLFRDLQALGLDAHEAA